MEHTVMRWRLRRAALYGLIFAFLALLVTNPAYPLVLLWCLDGACKAETLIWLIGSTAGYLAGGASVFVLCAAIRNWLVRARARRRFHQAVERLADAPKEGTDHAFSQTR
jgi:hypothetical protein